MSRTTIPEKKILKCDGCGKVANDNHFPSSGVFKISCNGLDFQGCAVGPGDMLTYDFCDSCYYKMRGLFAANLKELAEASKEPK